MLRLQKIVLTRFKNYESSSFEFNKNVIGISGLNGVGKTNLLDAIYYACFTKSYFTAGDALNVQFEQDGFRIDAHLKSREKVKRFRAFIAEPIEKNFS